VDETQAADYIASPRHLTREERRRNTTQMKYEDVPRLTGVAEELIRRSVIDRDRSRT
jgi:hypothetical protein